MKSESLIELAISYSAEHGVPVFPCRQDKSPTTHHGYKDASDNALIIRKMFANVKAE